MCVPWDLLVVRENPLRVPQRKARETRILKGVQVMTRKKRKLYEPLYVYVRRGGIASSHTLEGSNHMVIVDRDNKQRVLGIEFLAPIPRQRPCKRGRGRK